MTSNKAYSLTIAPWLGLNPDWLEKQADEKGIKLNKYILDNDFTKSESDLAKLSDRIWLEVLN